MQVLSIFSVVLMCCFKIVLAQGPISPQFTRIFDKKQNYEENTCIIDKEKIFDAPSDSAGNCVEEIFSAHEEFMKIENNFLSALNFFSSFERHDDIPKTYSFRKLTNLTFSLTENSTLDIQIIETNNKLYSLYFASGLNNTIRVTAKTKKLTEITVSTQKLWNVFAVIMTPNKLRVYDLEGLILVIDITNITAIKGVGNYKELDFSYFKTNIAKVYRMQNLIKRPGFHKYYFKLNYLMCEQCALKFIIKDANGSITHEITITFEENKWKQKKIYYNLDSINNTSDLPVLYLETVSNDSKNPFWAINSFYHCMDFIEIVSLGESAKLDCYINGFPKPSVTWWKDNKLINLKTYDTYDTYGTYGTYGTYQTYEMEQSNASSLLIPTVKLSELGTYSCQAYNGVGKSVTQDVVLKALGPVYASKDEIEKYKDYIVDPSIKSQNPQEQLMPSIYQDKSQLALDRKNCDFVEYPYASPSDKYLNNHLVKQLEQFSLKVVDDFTVNIKFKCHDNGKVVVYFANETEYYKYNYTKILKKPLEQQESVFSYNIHDFKPNTTYLMNIIVVVFNTFIYKSDIVEFKTTNFSLLPLQNMKYSWKDGVLQLSWDKLKSSEEIEQFVITIKNKYTEKTLRTEQVPIISITSDNLRFKYKIYNLPNADWYSASVYVNNGSRKAEISIISNNVKRPRLDGLLKIGSCTFPLCLLNIPRQINLLPQNSSIYVFLTNLSSEKVYNYTDSPLNDVFKQVGSLELTHKTWLMSHKKSNNAESFVLPIGSDVDRLDKDNIYEVSVVLANNYNYWDDYKVYKTIIDFSQNNHTITIVCVVVAVIIIILASVCFYCYRRKRLNVRNTQPVKNIEIRKSMQNDYNYVSKNKVHYQKKLPTLPGDDIIEEVEDHIYAELPAMSQGVAGYSEVYADRKQLSCTFMPRRDGSYILDTKKEINGPNKHAQTYEQMKLKGKNYENVTIDSKQNVNNIEYLNMNSLMPPEELTYVDMQNKSKLTDEDGYLKVLE